MIKHLIIIFIVTCCTTTAYSDTGNELKSYFDKCTENEYLYCGMAYGYIRASCDAFDGVFFSVQKNVTYKQLNDIVYKFLADHPEINHRLASTLVIDALSAAFPLKKVETKPEKKDRPSNKINKPEKVY